MTRRLLHLTLTMFAAGCAPTGVNDVTSERWVGELTSMNMMMLMTVAHRGTTLSGSGGFTALLVPGSEQGYQISGMRRADTLDILLKRNGEQVHFLGAYRANKSILVGNLFGGAFHGTPIVLRKD